MKKIQRLSVAVGLLLASATASASLITYQFGASGVTEGTSQSATAIFTFDTDNLGWMKLTLTDTVSPTAKIASELDGFEFDFYTGLASIELASVTPSGVVNCSKSPDPCPAGNGTSPYGWGVTLSGDDIALGAGFTNGGFAYHPYAIVNSSYDAPGGNGGVSNPQHNPLLIGPVDFIFSLSGLDSVPEIGSVSFLFGTNPDSQDGTCTNGGCDPPLVVPEPRTLALVAIGLLAIAWGTRRRNSHADRSAIAASGMRAVIP